MTLVSVGLTLLLTGFIGPAVGFPLVADVARADISRMLRSLEPTQTVSGTRQDTSARSREGGLGGTTAWRAVELAGMPVPTQQLPVDREPHLVFDADGRVSGADGCNQVTGSYTVNGSWLEFGPFDGTQMLCRRTEKVTRRFQEALKDTIRWGMLADRLQFYGPTGKPLAVFERLDPPSSSTAP